MRYLQLTYPQYHTLWENDPHAYLIGTDMVEVSMKKGNWTKKEVEENQAFWTWNFSFYPKHL